MIGIQGGKASYHEAVAQQLHPDQQISYYGTFADLFRALVEGQVQTAVVAVSNTEVGDITESQVELAKIAGKYEVLHTVQEPIQHSLLGLPGARIETLRTVHSQRPALKQCASYLAANSYIRPVEQDDTALSAKLVRDLNDPTQAAIASPAAGKLYGLVPLAESIQDHPDNVTTFIEIKPKEKK